MKKPWLSVLIPTYNGEVYLPFALDSIIAQEDPDVECIVIDDGSTDSTISILNTYQGRLAITILQYERQGNWVASTNYALSFATGEYVCFLHQDDIWFKNRLKIMKELIKQFPAINIFLHSSSFIDSEDNNLGLWRCPLPAFPKIVKAYTLTEKLLIQNFISIPAPIFKREIAQKVGGLDESLWYTADWDLWLKISLFNDAIYSPNPLSGFRVHPNSQTIARSSYLQDFRKQLESVFDKYFILWEAPEKIKKEIYKIAIFSIDVNVALAGTLHGRGIDLLGLFIDFLLLGPRGGYRYIKNSRIWERVFARLKAQLITRPE